MKKIAVLTFVLMGSYVNGMSFGSVFSIKPRSTSVLVATQTKPDNLATDKKHITGILTKLMTVLTNAQFHNHLKKHVVAEQELLVSALKDFLKDSKFSADEISYIQEVLSDFKEYLQSNKDNESSTISNNSGKSAEEIKQQKEESKKQTERALRLYNKYARLGLFIKDELKDKLVANAAAQSTPENMARIHSFEQWAEENLKKFSTNLTTTVDHAKAASC